jgi:hypothetical protein
MSVAGIPQEQIPASLRGGISEPTLRKHFRPELDLAKNQTTALAVGKLIPIRTMGDLLLSELPGRLAGTASATGDRRSELGRHPEAPASETGA